MRNPALMAELGLRRWLVFRHRALAMALTRVPEVNDAVVRGDIYVGGLVGEEWSWLMHDFVESGQRAASVQAQPQLGYVGRLVRAASSSSRPGTLT